LERARKQKIFADPDSFFKDGGFIYHHARFTRETLGSLVVIYFGLPIVNLKGFIPRKRGEKGPVWGNQMITHSNGPYSKAMYG